MMLNAEGFVRLYKLIDNGRGLQLVHKTALGGIPGALAGFKGRLLVGVGPIVRLYDLGKKKLLRKSEYRRCEWQSNGMQRLELPVLYCANGIVLLMHCGVCAHCQLQ